MRGGLGEGSSSAEALERLDVEAGPDRWLGSLATLRGDLDLEAGSAVLSTWDDDPWVGAAYSLEPPAAVRGLLSDPLGALTFAGEHLAPEHGALMEGALRSGFAAGRRVAERMESHQ